MMGFTRIADCGDGLPHDGNGGTGAASAVDVEDYADDLTVDGCMVQGLGQRCGPNGGTAVVFGDGADDGYDSDVLFGGGGLSLLTVDILPGGVDGQRRERLALDYGSQAREKGLHEGQVRLGIVKQPRPSTNVESQLRIKIMKNRFGHCVSF